MGPAPTGRGPGRPGRGRPRGRPQPGPVLRSEGERRREGVERGGVGAGVAGLQVLHPPPAQPRPLPQRLLGQPRRPGVAPQQRPERPAPPRSPGGSSRYRSRDRRPTSGTVSVRAA
jgi:hypothetical protein